MMRLTLVIAAVIGVAACTPPGKPKLDTAAENREALTDFKTLYSDNCSGCHGPDGKFGGARMLHDSVYLNYLGRDHLHDVIENGRPGTAMPAWSKAHGGPLTEEQVDALVNGIYGSWAQSPPPQDIPKYDSAPGDADHGKKLFQRDCFMCHFKGGPVGVVTDAQYASLVSNAYIRSAIVAGRADLGMPNYKSLNLGKPLTDADVSDLVAYVASFRPADAPTAPVVDAGSGQNGQLTKGNEGSGTGPGSAHQQKDEGNKGKGSSSIR